MKKIAIALSLIVLLAGCDSARRIGGAVLQEVPLIGQFVGEWLGENEDLALEIKLQDQFALVKQYFDGKLQQVATSAYTEGEDLIMEFTRKNDGKITGKLSKQGKLSVDYGDTVVVMDLEQSEI